MRDHFRGRYHLFLDESLPDFTIKYTSIYYAHAHSKHGCYDATTHLSEVHIPISVFCSCFPKSNIFKLHICNHLHYFGVTGQISRYQVIENSIPNLALLTFKADVMGSNPVHVVRFVSVISTSKSCLTCQGFEMDAQALQNILRHNLCMIYTI